MKITDIIEGQDGKMSLTNLAAASAYFLFAVSFLKYQVLSDDPFNEAIWLVFGGFAVAHQTVNRGTSMLKDFKEKQLIAENAPAPQDSPPAQNQ